MGQGDRKGRACNLRTFPFPTMQERFVQRNRAPKRRSPAPGRDQKNSPSRFRFRPPLPLTFAFRLPAFGLGFDLLALRARRKQHINGWCNRVKGSKKDVAAICEHFIFQHFHSQSSSLWTALWKGKTRRKSTQQWPRFRA